MNRLFAKSLGGLPQTALTLIEVVAALTLLTTLLVGILAAHRKTVDQLQRARHEQAAIAAADQLLASWMGGSREMPRQGSGQLDAEGLLWRTHVLGPADSRLPALEVVRLEIRQQSAPAAAPLLAVDVVAKHQPQGASPSSVPETNNALQLR